MQTPTGEMPFLDHLEELRHRILKALGSLIIGFGVGFWLVQRFQLVAILKRPIEPYLPTGKLAVLSPTDPVMIVFKLAFVVGLVLASPVLIWQLWSFLAPALYQKERRTLVPALFAGLLLFLGGAAGAWFFVVPKALSVMLSFQVEALELVITYDKYFGFVLQIVLALGISAELPLLMLILTSLGIVTPAALSRFRRVAIVLAFIAGALLSPGADIISMMMMTIPLILLYEVGLAGSILIHRARLKKAAKAGAVLLLVLAGSPSRAEAQLPLQAPIAGDTLRPIKRLDSASARRMGIPSGPTKSFPPPDSVMAALLDLDGFMGTRYLADTATITGLDRRLRLAGHAMTDRQGTIMEAGSISYAESECVLIADGDPRLFDKGSVVVGGGVRYDTCLERGVITDALTTIQQMGGDWVLRGNIAVDSTGGRIFAAGDEITSCDLPISHYHFQAKDVKWMSSSLMVARPAVLYVRDVPVAWLPFIFQETKPGRKSGILVPQFGFNDIVRTSTGYRRQVTDFGYYWAINDYLDAEARFNWFSGSYFEWQLTGQYRVLDRFFDGGVSYSRQIQSGGDKATGIRWRHNQIFGLTTTLAVNLNFNTDTRIVSDNALDPFLNTRQLSSDLNLTKRFRWGSATLGGTRRQTMGDDQVSQTLPALTVSPKPLDVGSWGTWSPAVSLRNDQNTSARRYIAIPRPGGAIDSIEQTPTNRTTLFTLQTPLRIGSFNLQQSLLVNDRQANDTGSVLVRVPNPDTPDPTDSITVTRAVAGLFATEMDWHFSFNLPIFLPRSWKLTPRVSAANRTSGPLAIRNERTDGEWVTQGKRISIGLGSSPTFFGFWPGFAGYERVRHTFSPLISWDLLPQTEVPEAYANAFRSSGTGKVASPASNVLRISLSQNFEAKQKRAPGDTLGNTQQRKLRLLSINTSGIGYDFERTKDDSLTGWMDASISNIFASDLLPGFDFSVSHGLWDGPVGVKGSSFDLFLQSINAGFMLDASTIRGVGAILGLNDRPTAPAAGAPLPGAPIGPTGQILDPQSMMQQRTLAMSNQLSSARRPFNMRINYTLSRSRPALDSLPVVSSSSLSVTTAFSPTRYWGINWITQYNVSSGKFESNTLNLTRDLHDWRAGFNFVRNPNGNFAFYVSVHLVDLPDLKLDYSQRTNTP